MTEAPSIMLEQQGEIALLRLNRPEMMLTGRRFDAADGFRLGLAHYLVEPGEALPQAQDLAHTIAANAPLSNYLMIQALARIDDTAAADGLFAESMAAALAETSADAKGGLEAVLARRTPKLGD